MVGVASVLWIVLLLAWAICLWKAYTEERWKLPLAGTTPSASRRAGFDRLPGLNVFRRGDP
jgi:uncharacterized membrane protein